MICLATAESGWGDLAPLFVVGVLKGLSPWLFALKGLPWFPKLPPGSADSGDGTARLLFTATASICCGWVYMIFVSLPPIHFLVIHRGMVSLLSSFVALLLYVILWLWLGSLESKVIPPVAGAQAPPWGTTRTVLFVVAFGFYVLTFTCLAISVSVATAFQENYLVEGEVVDAKMKADSIPQPVAEAIIKAQTLDASDIDETETTEDGRFLLVVPRKRMEGLAINIMATLQENHVPTSDQQIKQIHLRGWNKVRMIFHLPVESINTTKNHTASSPQPSSSPSKDGH